MNRVLKCHLFSASQHTVSRVGLLDQAEKLISDLGSSQSVLEIQYEGEVSTASWLHLDVKKYKAIQYSTECSDCKCALPQVDTK